MKTLRLGFDVLGYFSFTIFGTSPDFHLVIDPNTLSYDDWSLARGLFVAVEVSMVVVLSMIV
jgi:hypothetical protein